MRRRLRCEVWCLDMYDTCNGKTKGISVPRPRKESHRVSNSPEDAREKERESSARILAGACLNTRVMNKFGERDECYPRGIIDLSRQRRGEKQASRRTLSNAPRWPRACQGSRRGDESSARIDAMTQMTQRVPCTIWSDRSGDCSREAHASRIAEYFPAGGSITR